MTSFNLLALRRCLAGVLLSFPLLGMASGPQETFLPPQSIPLSGTMTYSKMVVADVNGDHYDDIVAIGTDTDGMVIDVYLNEGKTRGTSEAVNFTKKHIPLKGHTNTDAVADKVRFSGGYDLQVVDLDGDGYPDILASSASTGEIFILWNQGSSASDLFVFTSDATGSGSTSMTITSPLAMHLLFDAGNVLGTPLYVAAADLGDGSGRKSIIAYHGALQPDPGSKATSPFNQHNYEALAIFYPSSSIARGFNFTYQRSKWPGCDMSFGNTCPGWNDGMPAVMSDANFLYNFRIADKLNLNFTDAASDILLMDRNGLREDKTSYYVPATIRPNASPGIQVQTGSGPHGSDSVWLQGGGKANEFVANNGLALMSRRTAIDTVLGNERSAGSTFGLLSNGQTPLITAGGMRVVYIPSSPAYSTQDQSVPDYLNRAGQIGAWLNWAPLNTGSALLSLSDYCRFPDPCAKQFYWYHAPLDGSIPPKFIHGGSKTLVMLDFAQEVTDPLSGGPQFAPFFQKPDEAHFQAFTINNVGLVSEKPFIASGHFASPTESALVMLDHADGDSTTPTWNHLSLYRPDTAKTYASPTPHLEGLTVGRFISMGLADIGLTLPQGEISAVLVGSHLGTDTADGIRYVTVHDKATGAMKGIFPANPAETVKEISKDGVVVPGLSTLPVGNYTLEVHNATAMAAMNLNVVNPFGITTTDYDWRAGNTCGLLPNTKDANLWPKQIAISVSDFPGTVQAVRWINQDDGSVVNLGSEGATYDDTTKKVTLIIPQGGKLKDGKWRPAIKSNGVWQPLQRFWNVTHDAAALAYCAQQVNFINEEFYSQCTDKDYYLNPAQYKVWPNLVNGSLRVFGSGFQQNQIKSAAIKQGNHRYYNISVDLESDNELRLEFGDLSAQLTPDVEAELWFYSETGDVVEANGVPAAGGKLHWRTPRKGDCLASMPHFSSISAGSGKDGAFQAGDVITVTGENLIYPVPTGNRFILTDKATGTIFALPPRLPDDWYTTHYDNSNGKLLFVIPNDDAWDQYKIKDGDSLVADWAPPPYVEYTIQVGTTVATQLSVNAWAAAGAIATAGVAGYYLGKNADGIINWIRGGPGAAGPSSGKPGDNQPDDTEPQYWLAQYISSDDGVGDENLYVVVFRSDDALWKTELYSAIIAQGRGRYYVNGDVALWPCPKTVSACVVYAAPIGLARYTNPEGISFSYNKSGWLLRHVATGIVLPTRRNVVSGVYPYSLEGQKSKLLPVPGGENQFFWRFQNPAGYEWEQYYYYPSTMFTGPSNNCTISSRYIDSVCYQVGISP